MKPNFYTVLIFFILLSCNTDSKASGSNPISTTNNISEISTKKPTTKNTVEKKEVPEPTPYLKEEKNIEIIDTPTNSAKSKKKSSSTPIQKEILSPTAENKSEEKTEIIETTQIKEIIETSIIKIEIHKTWDDLVKKYISSSGKVNYAGFKKDKAQLEKYIKEIQGQHKNLNSWSKNKKLAYWINVYNAVTIKLIVDNYPLNSITDLHGEKPWDTKLITLGSKTYTLNDIENKIIRPTFKEPRIHFAVNCAAKSCPKIMNKAWTEKNIQRYLTKQTKAFLTNTTQNTIGADKVVLSKIFEWYKADFGGSDVKLIQFINTYSTVKVNANATISFKDYNWNLNK